MGRMLMLLLCRLQPQTKLTYSPGDTIVFRLPASALLDMATATLKFDFVARDTYPAGAGTAGTYPFGAGSTNAVVSPPRFNTGFFRRVDVMMGSTSVGLTGLHDYGCLSTQLYNHCVPNDNASADQAWVENGSFLPTADYSVATGLVTAQAPANNLAVNTTFTLPKQGRTFKPCQLRNFLGLLGGTYFRFLDTNLLPEVTINFTIASPTVIGASDIGRVDWNLQNVSLSFESINFGDGVYRSLVDQRLASGDLVLPFSNWVGFEGQSLGTQGGTGGSNVSTTQFTVATKSLNGVIATFRRGDYDASVSSRQLAIASTANAPTSYKYNTFIKTAAQGQQVYAPGTDYYQCFCGRDSLGYVPTTGLNVAPPSNLIALGGDIVADGYQGTAASITAYPSSSRWLDENGNLDVGEPSRSNGPSYQLTIDSKLYPVSLYALICSVNMPRRRGGRKKFKKSGWRNTKASRRMRAPYHFTKKGNLARGGGLNI